jgi:molybdenum cofactor cytidylyltransferase
MNFSDDDVDPDVEEVEDLNISVIILAAGSSSRMGKSKQLLIVDGQTLLVRAVNVALGSGAKDVIVVLGANEQNHIDVLKSMPIRIVSNHYWKSGLGSSIKTGLHFLIREAPETKGVIIMVCDQPGVSEAHLHALIAAFMKTRKAIIASYYSGTAGVPALFARSFFSNMLMLQDDHGAKKIIEQFPEQHVVLDFPEGAVDLDTVEDYENYLKQK